MKIFLIAITISSLLLFSASAWSASTKQEVIELKAQVAEVQKDLAEIKNLLKEGARAPAPTAAARRPPPFQERVVSIEDRPYLGKSDAKVTLMEFSDYQCPFCARIFRDVIPTLKTDYIDTGKVKLVMREYPLEAIHPDAMSASIAALCAGDEGKYWEMHDLMFANQRQLGQDDLKSNAETLGLSAAEFNECLDDGKYQEQVLADIALGKELGITGTPGFFLGLTDDKDVDQVNLTKFLRGAQPLANFKAHIDALLKTAD